MLEGMRLRPGRLAARITSCRGLMSSERCKGKICKCAHDSAVAAGAAVSRQRTASRQDSQGCSGGGESVMFQSAPARKPLRVKQLASAPWLSFTDDWIIQPKQAYIPYASRQYIQVRYPKPSQNEYAYELHILVDAHTLSFTMQLHDSPNDAQSNDLLQNYCSEMRRTFWTSCSWMV